MFDNRRGGPDAAATLSLVSASHRQILEHDCRLVELAAHWADLHHSDSQAPTEKPLPGAEQARQLGGEGTPEVLEFAPAELATHLETSYGAARSLMADAVDLRHRHPELWRLILTGVAPSWKARKAAQATRLSAAARQGMSMPPSHPPFAGCHGAGSKPCLPAKSSKLTRTPPNNKPKSGRPNASSEAAAPTKPG